jgi:hypothetical protein
MSLNKKTKRPSSANATRSRIKVNEQQQQTIPHHYASTEDDEFFASCRIMTRDDLLVALHTAKKKQNSNDIVMSQLKIDNQRLDTELLKQQRRIDRLLESMSGGKGAVHGAEVRKEIEKSMLVRQLKQQIVILRNNIVEKETELETQRKSMKSSKLMELLCENHEYSLEINRLREIIKQNQYTNQEHKKEKKHRSRNEIETMNSATVMMSKTTTGVGLSGGPDMKKPNSAISSPNQLGRLVRPLSASATSSTNRALVQDMLKVEDKPNPLTGPSLAELANRQLVASNSTNVNGTATNPITNTDIPVEPIPVEELKAAPPTIIPTPSVNALFKVGERVQGRFRGGSEWYDANIKNVLDGNLYHIVYDDGDEETGVSEDKLRKKENSKDVKINVSNTNTNTNTNTNRSNTPVSITGKFKVGDRIEAQYYNGTTWYEGKIAGLNGDGDAIKYDIVYSDGDREKAVSEEKIRLISEEIVTPKVPAILLAMPDTNANINTSNKITTSTNNNKENSQNNNGEKNFSKYLDDLSDDEENGLASGRGVYGADGDINNTAETNYDEDFDA